MSKSIGDLLDDPLAYFSWMRTEAIKFGVINAVTNLGLLEHIGPGPTAAAEIASKAGCDEDMVRRLLEYLAAQGVLTADGEERFSPTERSEFLQSIPFVTWSGAQTYKAVLRLDEAIKTGKTAYEVAFGLPVFEYLKANPDLGQRFAKVMSFTTTIMEDRIFASHSFKPFELAVDVGGSQGSFLMRLLKEHPSARGILFDRPETAEQAREPVATSGMGGRIDIVGGDFFESIPSGGDLYLVKQILHDWTDEECRAILRNIRAAIVDGGRLAILERVIPQSYTPHIAYDFDILMMLWTPGRERRLSEYEEMFADTGFRFDIVSESPAGMSVVEAVAV